MKTLLALFCLLPFGLYVNQDADADVRPEEPKPGTVKGRFLSYERIKTKGDTSERDVVLYLKPRKPVAYRAPEEPVRVRQKDLVFHPHVLPVAKGTRVRFENRDDVKHNVFSVDACCELNIDMDAHSEDVVVLAEPGVASVICRLHPDMSMFIVCLDTPYFTGVQVEKVKREGKATEYRAEYEIPGVAPGEYTLTFWNKGLPPREFPVTVTPGGVTVTDITIPKD